MTSLKTLSKQLVVSVTPKCQLYGGLCVPCVGEPGGKALLAWAHTAMLTARLGHADLPTPGIHSTGHRLAAVTPEEQGMGIPACTARGGVQSKITAPKAIVLCR